MEPLTADDWLDYGLEPFTAQLLEHRPGSKTAEASLSGQLVRGRGLMKPPGLAPSYQMLPNRVTLSTNIRIYVCTGDGGHPYLLIAGK